MSNTSGAGSPFSAGFSSAFGSGAASPLPPMSGGMIYSLRLDLARAIALINPVHPVEFDLTEAVRLINAVNTTMGDFS